MFRLLFIEVRPLLQVLQGRWDCDVSRRRCSCHISLHVERATPPKAVQPSHYAVYVERATPPKAVQPSHYAAHNYTSHYAAHIIWPAPPTRMDAASAPGPADVAVPAPTHPAPPSPTIRAVPPSPTTRPACLTLKIQETSGKCFRILKHKNWQDDSRT